ncbi:MAG: hypothetical protein EP344_07315 [Bacteroidetes bacterium]|nr:MAG: hypothetical protein EP344_07315 [Bacteroidota bacterium]
MPRILCLEGEKSASAYGNKSVRELMEFVEYSTGIGFDYFAVGGRNEMERRLHDFNRRKTYSMLYLSFRSSPGSLELSRDTYTLDDLLETSGGKWNRRILHLNCSRFLKIPHTRMRNFRRDSGLSILSGYANAADYLPAAILELAYLNLLNTYRTPSAIAKHLGQQQRFLIRKLGFKLYA